MTDDNATTTNDDDATTTTQRRRRRLREAQLANEQRTNERLTRWRTHSLTAGAGLLWWVLKHPVYDIPFNTGCLTTQ